MKTSDSRASVTGGSATLPFAPWLGVFETVRVEQGRAEFAEEHWRSLQAAAKALKLRVRKDFRKEISGLPKRSGRWRWIVESTRSYSLFTPEAPAAKPHFTLALAPQRVGSENWDARYKTLSYLTHWQARQAVRTDEALLLNEKGQIASGAMTNIFWVRDGTVYTPALRAGCRAGVMRAWVMQQIRVKEGLFDVEELDRATEIFLTNSMIGVMPVRSWNEKKLQREVANALR